MSPNMKSIHKQLDVIYERTDSPDEKELVRDLIHYIDDYYGRNAVRQSSSITASQSTPPVKQKSKSASRKTK